ncbi:MAG: LysM peptidoglycan-binding domain-containing protein [Nocardioides sp.]
MVLGSRGGPAWRRWGRCFVVWSCGTAVLSSLALLVARAGARDLLGGADLRSLPLDRALPDVCALVLLGCLAWAWLALTVTVASAGRQEPTTGCSTPPAWRLPDPLRRLVLGACGVALATGLAQPALAAHHAGASESRHAERTPVTVALVGLPLPERPVSTAQHPPAHHPPAQHSRAQHRTVVVRAGDCLWSIAAQDLPDGASDMTVVARWRQIYAANREVVGVDPDQLVPGQRLILPPHATDSSHPHHREDSR